MVRVSFDLPIDMISAAETEEIKQNPNNLCFLCPAHTITCSGPNELAMSTEELVDRVAKLAKLKRMTRANIADASALPEPTVVSVMTKKTLDPRHSTMQAISKSVNGACWGASPCYMASLLLSGQITVDSANVEEEDLLARVMELEKQNLEYQVQIGKLEHITDTIHESYKAEIDSIRDGALKATKYLRSELAKRDKAIATKDKMIEKLILKGE